MKAIGDSDKKSPLGVVGTAAQLGLRREFEARRQG